MTNVKETYSYKAFITNTIQYMYKRSATNFPALIFMDEPTRIRNWNVHDHLSCNYMNIEYQWPTDKAQ